MASISILLSLLLAPLPGYSAKYAYDLVKGSCDDFNTHVRDRGLKDSEGNTHVSTLGFTSCSFSAPPQKQQVKLEQQSASKISCASTDLSALRFESAETITIMKWDYGQQQVSGECRAELARLESAIKAHEAEHVADCKTILKDANKKWVDSSRVVKVCSEPGKPLTTEELMKKLNLKAQSEVSEQLSKMSREMEYKSRETHERIGYGTSAINCSKCISE